MFPFDDEEDPTQPRPFGFTGVDPQDLNTVTRRAVFNQFAPSADEVGAAEQEQRDQGILGTVGFILSLPEKLLFGQAIKGAVKGGIEGGVAGAVKGFLRGTPFAFALEGLGAGDLSDETYAADIRRAMGQQDVDEGVANFGKNLALDIALSPFELLAAPFALTKLGKAGGKAVERMALAKAVETGKRAALTFKIPFTKIILGSTNLGFRSGAIVTGQGLDALGSLLRKNKLIGSTLRMVGFGYPDVADPALAGRLTEAVEEQAVARGRQLNLTIKQFEQLPVAVRTLVQNGSDGGVLNALVRFGVDKIDDAGSWKGIEQKLLNPDVALRKARADALYKHDATFKALFDRAVGGDVEAINTLYHTRSQIPLPKDLLDLAGLNERVGVELSDVLERDGLAGRLGNAETTEGSTSLAGFTREGAAADAKSGPAGARLKAREQLVTDWRKLNERIAKGEFSAADIQQYLAFHRNRTTEMGLADLALGFMNETSEPFMGLYASSIMTTEAKKFASDHLLSTLGKYNYAAPKKFADMLDVEVNAVVKDFGTKATGFVPLKKVADLTPEDVLSRIFDRTFRRKLAKIDPNAVEFFQMLPMRNLVARAEAAGVNEARAVMARHAFDGEAVIEELSPDEFVRRGPELLAPEHGRVAIVDAPGTIPRGLTRGEAISKATTPEIASQFEISKHHIREDTLAALADTKRDADETLSELWRARQSFDDAVPGEIVRKDGELRASWEAKRSALNVREAKAEVERTKAVLAYHNAAAGRGAKKALDPALKAAYDAEYEAFIAMPRESRSAASLREHLANRVAEAEGSLRNQNVWRKTTQDALDDVLEDFHAELDGVSANYAGQIDLARKGRREALAGIVKDEGARLSLVKRLRERGLTGRGFADEVLAQEKFKHLGVMALDEAKGVVIDPRTGETVYDRVAKTWTPDTKIKIVTREFYDAYKQFATDLSKPDVLRSSSFVRGMDGIRQAWSAHTVFNPLFLQTRVRNWFQSTIAAASGGLGTVTGQWESARAMTALRKMQREGVAVAETLGDTLVSGTKIKLSEALDAARTYGVTGVGSYAFEAGLTLEQAAFLKQGAGLKDYLKDLPSLLTPFPGKKVGTSAWLSKGWRMEQTLDDHNRLAAFLGGLKRGMEPQSAAMEVRKWLYDSNRPMSYTERSLFRRLIPFYSFQKYAIGQFADLYFKRPGALTWTEKVRENAVHAAGLDEATLSTVMPRFIAEGYGIPFKNGPNGPSFSLLGTFLTVGEVAKIATAFDNQFAGGEGGAAGGLARYAITSMHPALQLAAQQIWKRDFYSDKPIQEWSHTEMFGIAVPKQWALAARQVRFVNELNRANVINLAEGRVIIDAVKRDSDRERVSSALSLASGAFSPLPFPRVNLVDLGHDGEFRRAELERELAATKGRIIRRGAGEDKATSRADLVGLKQKYATGAAQIRRLDDLFVSYPAAAAEAGPPARSTNPKERVLLRR